MFCGPVGDLFEVFGRLSWEFGRLLGYFYAHIELVAKFFSVSCQISGSQNWGFLVEILVLVGIGRSGRLIGFVSTCFRQGSS